MSSPSLWRRWIVGEWSWSRPLKSVGSIYGILFIIAVFFADKLIFVPPASTYDATHPALVMLPGEIPDEPSIATFWYSPSSDKAPVLLWTHGNAEDLGHLGPFFEIFAEQNVGILAIDYPGYGLSEGKPTEPGCYRAVDLAFRHLTHDLGIAADRIVIVGQSVGSGPAVWLAEKHPEVRGLVLISPFLSAFRVVTQIPLFPGDRFPNLHRMPEVTCPLLIFHGENDEVIPFTHGKKLFALHPGPEKAFVPLPAAGHNDLWARHFDTMESLLLDFAILKALPLQEKD
ncbi:MAG: alpha/beta hydrolase [Verrucomicrobiae bacterium]|nr:alpha/beta hydrolase [Verrucomicrobiae bacterium]